MECAASGQLSLSTLEAVVRGEAVVCSELEAMWGETALLGQTMVVTAAPTDPSDVAQAGTAARALSVLLMSKSQAKVVQLLIQVVVRAQNGQDHKLSDELQQQLGYLLVELHCRGYANGAAIIQRASVLLGQIPAGLPDAANSLKLQSVLFRLETLALFLSIDVLGAEDLPVRLDALRRQGSKLNNGSGDREATVSAVRALAADRGRMIVVQPVQRAETVLGTPWELGNNREYGHMSLLFKMLEEADKLDFAESHPDSRKITENTQSSLSPIALQQVLTKIEALQWDKNQLYQKVQGTLALLDVFNCAKGVVAGLTAPGELDALYSSKVADIDYVTTCDSSMQAEFNQAQILPIEQVLNTISRVQRGKSSLERLEIELVKGWSALYSLIVDGLALASANRIVQYVQSTVRGSIGVNNLMVLLRSERALLNELQADLSHLVTFSQLNVKVEEACASHSGTHILQEASAAISTALESAEAQAIEARWAVETLQDVHSAGEYFITHKRIDQDTPKVVLKGSQLLMSRRMAGYRVNELAQALVSLELKSVRAVDISGLANLKTMMKIQSEEPHKIRKMQEIVHDFQAAAGPQNITEELELEINSATMRKASSTHKQFQNKLKDAQVSWLAHRQVDASANRLGVWLRGDVPGSLVDFYKDSLRAAFQSLDRNGDGHITRHELQDWLKSSLWQDMPEVFKNLNVNNDADIERVFSLMDTDGDGVISFDELRMVMENELEESAVPRPGSALPTMQVTNI